ncbi:LysM peptidoglycan-binding domain-containing protein [Candidatus Binatus sp.]|uniref:LysM peptidoglycan-binding domain-containing protein n=1 Tax=Candidatus Binatus sp. TaxID=2811406 RepID=UPI002F9443B4
MSARRFSSTLSGLALAATLIVVGGGLAFAQSDFNESTIPPSAPPSRVVRPPSEAEPSEARDTEQPADQPAPRPIAKPDHPANIIPYTVRPGDSIGAIAQMFGITADELAHANRIHPDDELQVDEVLKVPHPFTTEVNTLKGQVEALSAQQQTAEQKADSAQEQVKSLQAQVQELTGDNQDLQLGNKLLPWWRATAVSLGFFALLMLGAILLTLFEWWRMRRRFVALAAMTDALSRLDYKYKAMFAKAELRLQQLYGRRRGGITEGQPRPKMPEEIEIERLNEELKQILELHLQRLGARLPGAPRRKGWREMFGGGDVSSTVEARSYRR